MYPDYRDVTIPPNIAPLNFMVQNVADDYVVLLEGGGRRVVVGSPGAKSVWTPQPGAALPARPAAVTSA